MTQLGQGARSPSAAWGASDHLQEDVTVLVYFKDVFMWTILKAFVEFITTLLLFYVLIFGPEACGALVPQPGIELALSALEGEILTPGPPGKPLHQHKF